jgi:hypothetical protein
MALSPAQYFDVDPAQHTLAGLISEITSTQVMLCGKSMNQSQVADWVLHCSGYDQQEAFCLARQIVRQLRGDNQGLASLEVDFAMKSNRSPSFS